MTKIIRFAKIKTKFGFVAQLVEQLTLNQLVEGSSPSGPNFIFYKNSLPPSKKKFLCVLILCMKILPINLNSFSIPKYNSLNHNQNESKDTCSNTANILQAAYYPPVSFSGDNDYNALVKDLKSLKNMHCPYCGTRMLSRDEMKTAAASMDNIKSVNDLFTFLNKYEDCVNPRFKNVVALVKQIGYGNFTSSSDNVLDLCRKEFSHRTDIACASAVNKFDLVIDTLPEDSYNRVILTKYKKTISDLLDKQKNHSLFAKEYFMTMKNCRAELQPPAGFKMYAALSNDMRDAFCNESLFVGHSGKKNSITKTFLSNLLYYSTSGIRIAADKAPSGIDNVILTCQNCSITNNGIYRRNFKKEAYYNHIYELCREALAGNLHKNKNYPVLLRNSVIKNYNNRLSPDNLQPDLRALLASTGLKVPKYAEFPLTDVPGIYCASCGQKTITNKQKEELYDKIEAAETMPDLLEIFHEYREFIKPKYEPLIDELSKSLMQNPNLTENSVMKSLRVFAYKNLQDSLSDCLKNVEDILDNYNLMPEEEAAVRKFISKANSLALNLRPETLFPMDDYHDILLEMTSSFRPQITDAVWDSAYTDVVLNYSCQLPVIPLKSVVEKGKSPLKIMAETIFNRSLATVDHLDPKSRYNKNRNNNNYKKLPENKMENLVVMCKDCNSKKSNTSLNHWLKSHPEMARNMEKYIRQIKQLRKDKIIGKEFEYYPYEVAARFARLTGIDISTTG